MTEFSQTFVAIDASSLRGDAFTFICGGTTPANDLVVSEVGGFEGDQLRHVSMADVVEQIAERAKHWRAQRIFGDQREEAALSALFAQHRCTLVSYAWSEPSKDDAVQLLRRLMRERRLYLPDHGTLRRELGGMKARLLPSGRISYGTNGLDYASALVTLAHAIVARDFVLGGARIQLPTFRPSTQSRWSGSHGRGFG